METVTTNETNVSNEDSITLALKQANLELYEKVREVPEEAKKKFNNGRFSGTDINPMWRIKKLTEVFGVCGYGWYYDIVSQRLETCANGEVLCYVDINLYVKLEGEWSKAIQGVGGNKMVALTSKGMLVSDECFKMSLTDALSVACKALGIGADVYFEKDKTKYTDEQNGNGESVEMISEAQKQEMRDLGVKFDVLVDYCKKKHIDEFTFDEASKIIATKRASLERAKMNGVGAPQDAEVAMPVSNEVV